MNKILIVLFLLLAPAVLKAASAIESADLLFSDAFKMRVGGYLLARNDTEIGVTSSYLTGATINLQNDLGMKHENQSVRLDGYYRFNDFHKIEFAYYAIKNSGSKVSEREFEFNGSTFATGANIDSALDLNIFKIDYAYSFYHNDKVELAIAGGLHFTHVDTEINGNAAIDGEEVSYVKERISVLAPLPILGLRMSYAVTPRFHVNTAFDYFGLSYDSFKGNFTDVLVTAEYQVFENWGAGVGLNVTSLDLEFKDSIKYFIEQDTTAVLAYITYNY